MQDDPSINQENQEPSRRRFLKAAAGAGVVGAVWSEPLIRGIPAYAADATSVAGRVDNQFITWSPMRDNWDDNTSGNIVQSPSLGMGNCGTSASYTVMGGTLGSTLSLTASMNPGGNTGCGGPAPAIVSLEPQTGCMFENVMATGSNTIVLINNGNAFQYTNTTLSGLRTISFNIVCG